jgi:hypothetical protein
VTKKTYIIYDARAMTLGPDEAQVLCCAKSLREARKDARMFGECAIFEYDLDEEKGEATNGILAEYVKG